MKNRIIDKLDMQRLECLSILEKWSNSYFQNYSDPIKKHHFNILRHAGFEKLNAINKRLCELQNINDMYTHPKYAY